MKQTQPMDSLALKDEAVITTQTQKDHKPRTDQSFSHNTHIQIQKDQRKHKCAKN